MQREPSIGGAQIWITGGAGFIGAALAGRLIAAGANVVVLDALCAHVHPGSGRPPRLPLEARLVPFDVTNGAAWDALLHVERPDVVVHLAAETGTGRSLRAATLNGTSNVIGTTAMLDAFSRAGCEPGHIVLASSRAVYGEGVWRTTDGLEYAPGWRDPAALEAGRWDPVGPGGCAGVPVASRAGTTMPQPSNIYAATKLAQEHLVLAWGRALGCPVSVLRLQNVYGPGQSIANSYTGVLTTFARRAVAGEPIDVYEDGRILRDFVFIDDVVEAFGEAVRRPPVSSRVIDIGSGRPEHLIDVAESLARAAGAPAPVVSGRFRPGDVRAAFCDLQDARRELGYEPRWALAQGLAGLVEFARQEAST